MRSYLIILTFFAILIPLSSSGMRRNQQRISSVGAGLMSHSESFKREYSKLDLHYSGAESYSSERFADSAYDLRRAGALGETLYSRATFTESRPKYLSDVSAGVTNNKVEAISRWFHQRNPLKFAVVTGIFGGIAGAYLTNVSKKIKSVSMPAGILTKEMQERYRTISSQCGPADYR